MGPGHERTDEQNGTGKVLKRRGLIAGAAALMAGIVAKQTAQHVGTFPPYAAGSIPFADGSGNLTQDTPKFVVGRDCARIASRTRDIAISLQHLHRASARDQRRRRARFSCYHCGPDLEG